MIIIQKTDIMYSDAMCQVFLHAINMWVSCTPCPNQRNLPILQVEECPGASNSSRFGWLLSLLEWSVFELRGFFLLEKLSNYFLQWVLYKIKVTLPNNIFKTSVFYNFTIQICKNWHSKPMKYYRRVCAVCEFFQLMQKTSIFLNTIIYNKKF